MIDLGPLWIVEAVLGVDHAVNMVDDAELQEGVVEEGAPLGVVSLVEVQRHRNMGLDVDEVDRGSKNWHRRRLEEGVGAVRRGAVRG
jgi:hypothetical protein